MFAWVNAWPMNAVCTAWFAKSSEFSSASRFAPTPLVGRPLVGRPLVGRPLVGKPLVGSPFVGSPLVGRPAVVKRKSAPNPAAPSALTANVFMRAPRLPIQSVPEAEAGSRERLFAVE